MKMVNSFNDSGTEVVKMIYKLKWVKVRKGDWELFSNSDVAKQKFKELRKFIQKEGKFKRSDKVIQFIEENDDTKTKLIKKLKKEACRAVKKIIAVKDINEENELNNNNDLKDSASTSKGLKNKLGFIKSAVSMQSFLHI